ncbi:winged helix-turn-helix transcriptional regulator [Streptomyces rubrogriseus]|uniref:winged helix-turn-helix transcriptional regulator n=1 Tax=Streptomyces rubrogriseus TaxID=194673 RepID=UPI003564C4A6
MLAAVGCPAGELPDAGRGRLSELSAAGLAHREVEPGPPVTVRYRLTPDGTALMPLLTELAGRAARHLPGTPAARRRGRGWTVAARVDERTDRLAGSCVTTLASSLMWSVSQGLDTRCALCCGYCERDFSRHSMREFVVPGAPEEPRA